MELERLVCFDGIGLIRSVHGSLQRGRTSRRQSTLYARNNALWRRQEEKGLRGGGLGFAMGCGWGALGVKGRTVGGQTSKECGFLVGWATQRTIADQQKSAEDQRDGEFRRGRELDGLYAPVGRKRELKHSGGRLSHTQSLADAPAGFLGPVSRFLVGRWAIAEGNFTMRDGSGRHSNVLYSHLAATRACVYMLQGTSSRRLGCQLANSRALVLVGGANGE